MDTSPTNLKNSAIYSRIRNEKNKDIQINCCLKTPALHTQIATYVCCLISQQRVEHLVHIRTEQSLNFQDCSIHI